MSTAIHVIGWWVGLNLTIGPCLTWWLFRSERRRREVDEVVVSATPAAPESPIISFR
jgi:hypothetical protein